MWPLTGTSPSWQHCDTLQTDKNVHCSGQLHRNSSSLKSRRWDPELWHALGCLLWRETEMWQRGQKQGRKLKTREENGQVNLLTIEKAVASWSQKISVWKLIEKKNTQFLTQVKSRGLVIITSLGCVWNIHLSNTLKGDFDFENLKLESLNTSIF